MYDEIRLVHCLKRFAYLKAALRDGLMLTDHEVRFRPFKEAQEIIDGLLRPLAPLLRDVSAKQKLEALLAGRAGPNDAELSLLMRFVGSIRQQVPMLCFSEVVGSGRDLRPHTRSFGRYGIVLKPEWVMAQGGDRVVYVGDGRAVGHHLGRMLGAARILSISRDQAGQLLMANEALALCFDLVAFVEIAEHQHQFEWRIVGRHGLMGGPKDTQKKLPLDLRAVEHIYVHRSSEISAIHAILRDRRPVGVRRLPPVSLIAKLTRRGSY